MMDIKKFLQEKNYNFKEIAKEFEIIEKLKVVEQNSSYHGEGNVYKHTSLVCMEVLKLEEWKDLKDEERAVLYFAALFHDIGKVFTTRNEEGQIVSPRHAIKGAKVFRDLAYREYEIKKDLREDIASLIRYHGLPLYFLERESIDYDIIKAAEVTNLKLLYLLSKCDLMGRICADKEIMLEKVMYFKSYSKELGCFYGPKKFKNDYTRFLYLTKGNVHFTAEVFDNRDFEVKIMVGVPLVGKDTYINEKLKSLKVVSVDDIREEINISPKKGFGKVGTIAFSRAKEFLRKKEAFVWNATNLKRENRQKLIRLCTAYGARVRFIYLEVEYKELLKRNKLRKRSVPVNIINKMIKNMDMLEGEEIQR
ncbi:hypothetical protein CLAUR_016180 [Clostridium felsineum]|nr:hypothetical protein CLAUR_016180 [Clostridium felsineum]